MRFIFLPMESCCGSPVDFNTLLDCSIPIKEYEPHDSMELYGVNHMIVWNSMECIGFR